jgi:hypothetical protein
MGKVRDIHHPEHQGQANCQQSPHATGNESIQNLRGTTLDTHKDEQNERKDGNYNNGQVVLDTIQQRCTQCWI